MTALERAKFEHSQVTQGFPNVQHLQELDEYEKEHKAFEIAKKVFKCNSLYAHHIESAYEDGWISKEECEFLQRMIR